MTTTENPTVQAVRVWHGTTPKVHVTIDGVPQKAMGGNRAARCSFVLVWSFADDNGDKPDGSTGYGARFAGMHRVQGLRSAPVSRVVDEVRYGVRQHYTEQTYPIVDEVR